MIRSKIEIFYVNSAFFNVLKFKKNESQFNLIHIHGLLMFGTVFDLLFHSVWDCYNRVSKLEF